MEKDATDLSEDIQRNCWDVRHQKRYGCEADLRNEEASTRQGQHHYDDGEYINLKNPLSPSLFFRKDVFMTHKDKTKCIICSKRLSKNEINCEVAMGDDNCVCWREWSVAMNETRHGGKKQGERDRIATKKLMEMYA